MGRGRPLHYLSEIPFPELNLTIDKHPVRIARTSDFGEETDRETVDLPTAIATTLWLWHPNALRAFLDFDKYPHFEWIRRNVSGDTFYNTCVIDRFDRVVVAGFYNDKNSWAGQCTVRIEPSGAWVPTKTLMHDMPVKNIEAIKDTHRSAARQMFYHEAWKSIAPGLEHALYLAERDPSMGLRCRNPRNIYHDLGDGVINLCEGCGKGYEELDVDGVKLKFCVRCHNTQYCSLECQKKDWNAHRCVCGKKKKIGAVTIP